MSFFKLSTGEKVVGAESAEMGGGDIEPMPDGTTVRAIITEAKWEIPAEGDSFIKLRWDVVDGEYKKRVVFQKIRVEESDAKKRDKAIAMLAAIDFNTGGKLLASDEKPTDQSLMMNLTNKPMVLLLRVWDMDGKKGNWVQKVASAKASAPAPSPKPAPKPAAESFDDDIAF